jgi:hypothetical protein
MNRIKTPQFLEDLYRDLRDRRLLIPAIALVVALLAVPVLLSTSSEPAPAAPSAAPAPESAEAVAPAVLAEQTGIRDYHKRLDALKEQDPFNQRYSDPDPKSVAIDEPAASSPESSATSTAAPSLGDALAEATGATSTGSPAENAPAVTETPDDSTQPSSQGGGEHGGANPKPEIRFVVGRVDIAFGPVGETKTLEGVRELDLIPGEKNPLAAFIGLAGNGDHAVFGLTPSVVDTRGEGSCSPKKPDPCQFLRLGEDEVRFLKTSSGETYKLKLLATHLVGVQRDAD